MRRKNSVSINFVPVLTILILNKKFLFKETKGEKTNEKESMEINYGPLEVNDLTAYTGSFDSPQDHLIENLMQTEVQASRVLE